MRNEMVNRFWNLIGYRNVKMLTCKLVVAEIKNFQVRQFDDVRRNRTYTKSSQNSVIKEMVDYRNSSQNNFIKELVDHVRFDWMQFENNNLPTNIDHLDFHNLTLENRDHWSCSRFEQQKISCSIMSSQFFLKIVIVDTFKNERFTWAMKSYILR